MYKLLRKFFIRHTIYDRLFCGYDHIYFRLQRLHPLQSSAMPHIVVLCMSVEGYKKLLSITAGANATSKFWL